MTRQLIAKTEEERIKRHNEWKDNVESKGTRVNMNKTKVRCADGIICSENVSRGFL